MSQEKIDRYKEEKANRKKNVSKQKRNALLAKIAGVIVAIGIVVWFGWSGYRSYQQHKEEESYNKAMAQAWEEYSKSLATSATSSTGVNLEQDPSNVTTSGETSAEGETTETETTAATEEETSQEETSAE